MKTLIVTVLTVFVISCTEENEIRYSVDPALSTYVETFYAEAAERGVTIPKNLVATLSANVQGISKADIDMEQNRLIFNEVLISTMPTSLVEAHVYYRLGGLFLKKNISEGVSFMNPDYMFTPYNPVNKEAMFDALFQ